MKVGVVGATGEVGRTMIRVLKERNHEFDEIRFFSSERSAGTVIEFNGSEVSVEKLTEKSMEYGFDFLLFSAGKDVSGHFAPIAAAHGSAVIDNSSAFRMDPSVPLVVPEVNPKALDGYRGIVANPNCSTIQLVLALNPIHLKFKLKRVIVTTMQAVSGSGHKGIEELERQIADEGAEASLYPRKIAYNCIPQIGPMTGNGFTEEEMKMYNETRKIMGCDCDVEAMTVRVPVTYGHSESVFAEFEKPFQVDDLLEIWKVAPSVRVWENYPTAVETVGDDLSHVGRIRLSHDGKGVFFWNVADNVRVGAATNAVRILEHMMGKKG